MLCQAAHVPPDALIREGFLIIFPSGVILVNNHPLSN